MGGVDQKLVDQKLIVSRRALRRSAGTSVTVLTRCKAGAFWSTWTRTVCTPRALHLTAACVATAATRHVRTTCAETRIGAADDAGVRPRVEVRIGQAVGNDDLVDGVVEPGDLALDRRGVHIVGDRWPVALESLERASPEEERIGGPKALGVVVGEGDVEGHSHDVVVRAGVEAVDRDDVADDELAHDAVWTDATTGIHANTRRRTGR